MKTNLEIMRRILVFLIFATTIFSCGGGGNEDPLIPTTSVQSVKLNKTAITKKVGETEQLTATVLPANATNKNVTWTSSDNTVATVDTNGKVTAKKVGTAKITVTTQDGNKKAECIITVEAATVAVTGVTLNKQTVTKKVGETEQLTATLLPANATNKNLTWTSSNDTVATVDANGKLTAKAVGTAVITVKTEDGGKTATCSVTVQPKDADGNVPDMPGEDY